MVIQLFEELPDQEKAFPNEHAFKPLENKCTGMSATPESDYPICVIHFKNGVTIRLQDNELVVFKNANSPTEKVIFSHQMDSSRIEQINLFE